MKITDDIKYIGCDDHEIDLFESQFDVPNGMSYNSYVILDDKVAVMDAMDGNFVNEWMDNLVEALDGRTPDYLVMHHMEPDHSCGVDAFLEKYPDTTIVASKPALKMMTQFYGHEFENTIDVKEGSVLKLGHHTLQFIGASMVHWPEVLMSYDATDKVLFSADGFGKFGANDVEDEWACEARRYYFGIVGKFGANVQAVLKKAADLDIKIICSLHGPVLSENLGYYLDLYNTWSSYGVETDGVLIAYTSVYGHTRDAAQLLYEELENNGVEHIEICDLARDDMFEAMEAAFRYGKVVLATTTYNMSIFPFMHDFIDRLVEHKFQNRKIALIENGSWAPRAAKIMTELLEPCENLEFIDTITIKGAMTDENKTQIKQLASNLKLAQKK